MRRQACAVKTFNVGAYSGAAVLCAAVRCAVTSPRRWRVSAQAARRCGTAGDDSAARRAYVPRGEKRCACARRNVTPRHPACGVDVDGARADARAQTQPQYHHHGLSAAEERVARQNAYRHSRCRQMPRHVHLRHSTSRHLRLTLSPLASHGARARYRSAFRQASPTVACAARGEVRVGCEVRCRAQQAVRDPGKEGGVWRGVQCVPRGMRVWRAARGAAVKICMWWWGGRGTARKACGRGQGKVARGKRAATRRVHAQACAGSSVPAS